MLFTVDDNGGVQTFEDCEDAEASRAWSDVEDSVYVVIDDRGVLYRHYFEAEPGYYRYTLRATDIMVPTALAILKRRAGVKKLSPTERHELALGLSRSSATMGRQR
jgi:hypothetical protein